jgi:hypothetical protein
MIVIDRSIFIFHNCSIMIKVFNEFLNYWGFGI